MTHDTPFLAEFFRFLVVTWGLTYLVAGSSLFEPARAALVERFGGMAWAIYCAACVGGWAGIAAGLVGLWPWTGHTDLFEAALAGVGVGSLLGSYVPGPPEPRPRVLQHEGDA